MARGGTKAAIGPWAGALCVALWAVPVHGQDAEGVNATVQTIVLRDTADVDPDVADAVDGEVLRALRDVAGVDAPSASPVSFGELATAAGCEGSGAGCLASVAEHLEVDSVLLRRLETDGAAVRLTLVYDDPHISDEPPRVERRLAPGADLSATIDAAVRALFGIPEPPSVVEEPAPEPAPPSREPPPRRDASVGVATVAVLGMGGLILVGGAVAGVLSLSAQSDYEEATVTTRADADRALDALQAADERATVANVLFMVGAAVSVTGAVMLALDLGLAADGNGHVDVAAGVTPSGGMVTVGGAL